MPAVGLGVYRSAPEETVDAIVHALRAGYRLIDTATVYGNEREVGEAIAGSGLPRSDVFVTTKLWISDFGRDEALRAFDISMEKLGLDVLDLYLLHFPVPSSFDRTVEAYQAAEMLLGEGRVRAIGVSNFRAGHLERLAAESSVVPAVNQVELHPFFSQREMRETHARLGIATQSWSPIGGVLVYDANDPDTATRLLDYPVITGMATRLGRTPAQVVLRWHLQHGLSPIPKSVNPERIAGNIAVFDFALSDDDMAALDGLDRGARGGPDPNEFDLAFFEQKLAAQT
ncbi:aldo/keto reductase [Chenggangzhangella methanolivorans]|nr:aldo/keto reductase [Chenggangzhangella methanolivorans]QZO02236.1 aldo/keto reductase [Chenggangzhangella methanolivorans]